jgi:SnoaL-like domain
VTTTQASGIRMQAEEAADRLAIRELFDAYAHCADRRDARGQMALFTPDTARPEPEWLPRG